MREQDLLDPADLTRRQWAKPILRFAVRLFNPLLRLREINSVYATFSALRREAPQEGFFAMGLKALDVRFTCAAEDRARIPREGPVFLMANHPYGGVDGLILGALLDEVRPDGKLLVNFMLDRIDHMGGRCFYVDPFGGEAAAQFNFKGVKNSLSWLRGGKALATFPAGEVSHLRWNRRRVTDPQWAHNLAQIVQRSGATVVPVYFSGRNSWLFQLAGLLHPRLRTLLLPREMLRLRGQQIHVRIGNPIAASKLEHFGSAPEIMDFLRLRCYILQNRAVSEKVYFTRYKRVASAGKPIASAQPVASLEAEIADLPVEACLARQGAFVTYVAKAGQIPRILLELGRLREITFRAVGEGTGEANDLDRYDSTYWHLFVWHETDRCLVGAYRLGLSDEILPLQGKKGLYTSTLFRFAPGVMDSLNPAIELGRSFVVQEYQRRPQSLALLWRGIGRFIVRNPRYKTLFGPVSISTDYQKLSKNLMLTYLREHAGDDQFANLVRARKAPRSRFFGALDKRSFRRSVRCIEDVSALISEIEAEEKGVPVLLRQYLKLNARLLCFNVDPAFNNCIDGLVRVDLRQTSFKSLSHYMGNEGARHFLHFHNIEPTADLAVKN